MLIPLNIGQYIIDELGELNIFKTEDHLGVYAEFIGDTVHILAENDSVFFDEDDGTPFRFTLENDSVLGFSVQGFTANRLK